MNDQEARRAGRTADPFSVFLEAHRRVLPATRAQKRFNSGEHVWLGAHGAALACETLQKERSIRVESSLFTEIPRRSPRELLDYGELVALSGDFYESPEALFDEKPARLPWLWEDNDLADLRELFTEELTWIEERARQSRDATYPDNNLRFAWNAKAYVELALRNTDHFGWHNMLAYVRHHRAALQLAYEARGRENDTFRRALYTNAFADHFLTDGFAAGHVRVPRAEIRAWAEQQKLNDRIAGALSKLLHDQDGHVDVSSLHSLTDESTRAEHDGLRVQDSTGARWTSYCDGQLFLFTGALQSEAVKRPVLAVSASVQELLLAWRQGELPAGEYAATRYVPFPDPDAPTLIDKFSATMPAEQLDALWNSVGWYSKIPWISGLQREHVRALFRDLPGIMQDFRANVAADLAADPDIRKRVAQAYIAQYTQVS